MRENNKNKYGIDKNHSNHRVTQKVWRLPGGDEHHQQKQQQQQQQQQQEKDKNMHSMTSRHQGKERQGHGYGNRDDNDITKVKTLQDATLKASRLYGMMRDFINSTIPTKINYQKIHSKWRNMKKQVQVGGDDKIMFVSPKAGTGAGTGAGAVPVDDKDCVELPPKLSLHVTQDPLDPKKFIVKKLPGDPLVDGSLTMFAEGLMGHLDKMKSDAEFDIGDADILALIAHDLIGIILDVLDDEDEDEEDDEEDAEDKKRKRKAALDRESRNAAAAAIIIALIGLIKKKKKGDSGDEDIESFDNKDATIHRLEDEIEQLCNIIVIGIRALREVGLDNQGLRDQVGHLQQVIQNRNVAIRHLVAMLSQLRDVNALNAQDVARLQRDNQALHDDVQRLNAALRTLQYEMDQLGEQNADLRANLEDLHQELENTQRGNAELQEQLDARDQQLEAQRVADQAKDARIDVLQTGIRTHQRTVARLGDQVRVLTADAAAGDVAKQQELAAKQRELETAINELQAAQQQVAALGAASAAKDGRLVALEAQHLDTQGQLHTANQRAQELQQQLDQLGSTSSQEKDQLQAEIDLQKREVDELAQKLAKENALLDKLRDEVAEMSLMKEDSDNQNAERLRKAKADYDAELRRRDQGMAEKDATIEGLKKELERLRNQQESRHTLPPPEVVDDSKLLALQDDLRKSLQLAASKATENLDEVFPGDKVRIRSREECVRDTSAKIISLIDELNSSDAQGTVEKPTEKVSHINGQIQLMREMCKSKLRTFIVQRGGEKELKDSEKSFIISDNSTTINLKVNPKENKPWGPFTGIYNEQSENKDKFKGVRSLIQGVPQGKVVVIFGYGYSGSGKTYTLFGDSARNVDGIAQLAIDEYLGSGGVKVCVQDIYELYNDTYQASESGSGPGRNEFYYGAPTETKGYNGEYRSDEEEACTRIMDKVKFNDILKRVEKARLRNGHIFPTHNNPQSSRGHLFIELKVQKDGGPPGYLVICDMGGRENPNEMWQNPSYRYCSSPLPVSGEPDIPGPIVRNEPGKYYKFPVLLGTNTKIKDATRLEFDTSVFKKGAAVKIVGLTDSNADELNGKRGTLSDYNSVSRKWSVIVPKKSTYQIDKKNLKIIYELTCPDKKDPVTTYQAVTGSKSDTHTGLSSILQVLPGGRYKSAAFIMKTLREAFYINDSINHLLYHFEYYGKPRDAHDNKRSSNWDTAKEAHGRATPSGDGVKQPNTRLYYPDIYVTIPQTRDKQEREDEDTIGMRKILKRYDDLARNPDNVRYCTFACIRPEKEFEEDSINTLKFASQVNSCGDAKCDARVCDVRSKTGVLGNADDFGGRVRRGLAGGAKTRRKRLQGKVRTQRRRRRIVKPKSHPVTVTTQRRNMRDKKKGRRTRKMK